MNAHLWTNKTMIMQKDSASTNDFLKKILLDQNAEPQKPNMK